MINFVIGVVAAAVVAFAIRKFENDCTEAVWMAAFETSAKAHMEEMIRQKEYYEEQIKHTTAPLDEETNEESGEVEDNGLLIKEGKSEQEQQDRRGGFDMSSLNGTGTSHTFETSGGLE